MTVRELIKRLEEVPADLPVIVHYDGDYQAEISDVRLSTDQEKDRLFARLVIGEHVVIQVET